MSTDEKEVKSRKPANTAFKQQRLKSWQPILTPKTVIPTFLAIGCLFAPIGGLLLWASNTVSEISIDYTHCDSVNDVFQDVPASAFSSNFPGLDYETVPQYKSVQSAGSSPSNASIVWPTRLCTIKFNVPADMKQPVYMYYRLTNFYQNHRRYVKSLDTKQLSGVAQTAAELKSGGCDPLYALISGETQVPIYPCGLIANSMFNDTISLSLVPDNSTGTATTGQPYLLSDTGIAWPSDARKYGPQPYANLSQIVPPPYWALRYPHNYTADNPPLDVTKNEHFQVWMRTAGLPNFRKLYSKNEQQDLKAGTYTVDVQMNFNTTLYGGTKSIVLSTVSFMGGRNPFLGIAYVVVGGLCIVLGVLFGARHLYRPRRLGDHTYLSWNQSGATTASGVVISGNHNNSPPPTATTTGANPHY